MSTATIRNLRLGRALADSLSLSRIVFAGLILYCERKGLPLAAFLLFLAMDISDILDGAAARKFGCPSAKGAALDCGVDFVVLFALVAFRVRAGDLPWHLPALMVLSFGAFALESLRLGGPPRSLVGKYSGAVLYLMLTVDSAARAFFPGVSAQLAAFALAAELVLGVSVLENAVSFFRSRRR